MLVPIWLHVGLPNRRFSDFWRFQEAFKISSFFASIFYRFWVRLGLQHGAILGAKTAPNLKRWLQKKVPQLPKSGSGYEPAFEERLRASWPRFLGGQGSIFDDFWMIFGSFLAYFGHVFACSFLPWFSSFLVRSSANFAKKIQELAEDKAENPRTCRGQSREENPYERLQENSNLQAFFFQTPFLPKTLGGGTPPRGASIVNLYEKIRRGLWPLACRA